MKTAIKIGLLIILPAFRICDSYAQDRRFAPMISTIITPEKGTDMLHQGSRETPKKVRDFYALTPGSIDTLLLNFDKIKKVKTENGKRIKDIDKYGYQYLGVIIKNKKYIYINAFFVKSPQMLTIKYRGWQTDPIIGRKGGRLYWGILFDVEKGNFSDLSINEV
jgi:hypothetical protein